MRSIAEIDRDHEGMGRACVRPNHGCTYPACECDRSKRIVPNVRGIGGPKLTREQIEQSAYGVPPLQAQRMLTFDEIDAVYEADRGNNNCFQTQAADLIRKFCEVNGITLARGVAACTTEQDCGGMPWCRINGKCQRTPAAAEV